MDLAALKTELTTDPAALGYGALADTAASDYRVLALITDATKRLAFASSLTAAQIARNVDATEYLALTQAQRDYLGIVLSLGGDIDMTNASKILAGLQLALASAPNTRGNLGVQLTIRASRAVELGFADITVSDISNARRA